MSESADRTIGRYVLFDEIAAGGMATVHLGKLKGPVGFSRTVAIKKLHPEYARDSHFVSMFLDEARLASRVRHPNVVPTLDVVTTEGQLFLVMEYVQGVSLASLLDTTAGQGERIPPAIVSAIVSGALMGLHAAHEACDEDGANLGIVHRDVSPSNVLVGVDGMPRVLDFGVAKAAGRMHNTRGNVLKGTLGYIAPEQFNKDNIDRRADIYSASVMLWETLCGKPLFEGETEYAVIAKALFGAVPAPSDVSADLAPFDAVVMKGLDRDPNQRFDTAREMALAIEQCAGTASNSAVAEWLSQVAGDTIAKRAQVLAAVEGGKGRRVSEIRAAMLDALDLEDFDELSLNGGEDADDAPPSTDLSAARDMRASAVDSGTTGNLTAAQAVKPAKRGSALRVTLGVAAIAAGAALGVMWMQREGTGAPLEESQAAGPQPNDGALAPGAGPDPASAGTNPAGTNSAEPGNTNPASTKPAGTESAGTEPSGVGDPPQPSAAPSAEPTPSAVAPTPAPAVGPRAWPPRPTPVPSPSPTPAPGGKKPWETGGDRFGGSK